MTISQFNYLESGLWCLIGVGLLIRLVVDGIFSRYSKVLCVAAVTFFVFGVSDVIEAHTGAWWRPWWLLFIKSGCVLSFLGCLLWYKRILARGI